MEGGKGKKEKGRDHGRVKVLGWLEREQELDFQVRKGGHEAINLAHGALQALAQGQDQLVGGLASR